MAKADVRLLVVDDDPVIVKLLQVNFEMEGYNVLTANDGVEGLEKARAERPDVVILDIMMPKLDGYQTCTALKSDDSTKGIPVVFLSAKAQQSDIDKGKAAGVADYLTKPFDPNDLIEVVERLLP